MEIQDLLFQSSPQPAASHVPDLQQKKGPNIMPQPHAAASANPNETILTDEEIAVIAYEQIHKSRQQGRQTSSY